MSDSPNTRDIRPRLQLKAARENAGLTIQEAAKRCGFRGKSGWAMVELGRNTPPVERMKQMAQVLGVPASAVFDEFN